MADKINLNNRKGKMGSSIVSLFQLHCLLVAAQLLPRSLSLSSPSSFSDVAELNRLRLSNALSSPSGKLTFSPEMFIPEATNPTAILLQTSLINQLSERVRVEAKANAVFLSSDSLSSLRTFCEEQEAARGNFPGPVPVIYCKSSTTSSESIDENNDFDFSEIASTGVSGVLIPINEGSAISSINSDIVEGEDCRWIELCKNSLDHGLQPIPEIRVNESTAAEWKEEEMESLVKRISSLTGEDPVSILLTINPTSTDKDTNHDEDTVEVETDQNEQHTLPVISKSLGKRVSIIASIRTSAGGNRIGEETSLLKSSGFKGAFLRRECIPSYPINPNLEYLSDFWVACISDLKSTRSKSFDFRSKNNMEKNVGTQWANYQEDVITSGALGDPDAYGPPPGLDTESGDYQGF